MAVIKCFLVPLWLICCGCTGNEVCYSGVANAETQEERIGEALSMFPVYMKVRDAVEGRLAKDFVAFCAATRTLAVLIWKSLLRVLTPKTRGPLPDSALPQQLRVKYISILSFKEKLLLHVVVYNNTGSPKSSRDFVEDCDNRVGVCEVALEIQVDIFLSLCRSRSKCNFETVCRELAGHMSADIGAAAEDENDLS